MDLSNFVTSITQGIQKAQAAGLTRPTTAAPQTTQTNASFDPAKLARAKASLQSAIRGGDENSIRIAEIDMEGARRQVDLGRTKQNETEDRALAPGVGAGNVVDAFTGIGSFGADFVEDPTLANGAQFAAILAANGAGMGGAGRAGALAGEKALAAAPRSASEFATLARSRTGAAQVWPNRVAPPSKGFGNFADEAMDAGSAAAPARALPPVSVADDAAGAAGRVAPGVDDAAALARQRAASSEGWAARARAEAEAPKTGAAKAVAEADEAFGLRGSFGRGRAKTKTAAGEEAAPQGPGFLARRGEKLGATWEKSKPKGALLGAGYGVGAAAAVGLPILGYQSLTGDGGDEAPAGPPTAAELGIAPTPKVAPGTGAQAPVVPRTPEDFATAYQRAYAMAGDDPNADRAAMRSARQEGNYRGADQTMANEQGQLAQDARGAEQSTQQWGDDAAANQARYLESMRRDSGQAEREVRNQGVAGQTYGGEATIEARNRDAANLIGAEGSARGEYMQRSANSNAAMMDYLASMNGRSNDRAIRELAGDRQKLEYQYQENQLTREEQDDDQRAARAIQMAQAQISQQNFDAELALKQQTLRAEQANAATKGLPTVADGVMAFSTLITEGKTPEQALAISLSALAGNPAAQAQAYEQITGKWDLLTKEAE